MSTRDGLRDVLNKWGAEIKTLLAQGNRAQAEQIEAVLVSIELGLRELIAKWRKSADEDEQFEKDWLAGKVKWESDDALSTQGSREQKRQCADELEAALAAAAPEQAVCKNCGRPLSEHRGDGRCPVLPTGALSQPAPAAEAGPSFDALTWLKKEWPYDWATFNVRQLRAIEEVYAVGYQAGKAAAAPGLSPEAVRDALRNFASEPGTDGDWCACVDISEDSEDLPKLLRLLRSFEA